MLSGDFLFAKAVVRLHPGAGLTVEHWGSPDMFKAMVVAARTLEDWELVAFAIIAAGGAAQGWRGNYGRSHATRAPNFAVLERKEPPRVADVPAWALPTSLSKGPGQAAQVAAAPISLALHGSIVDVEASMARLFSGTAFQALRFHSCGRFGAATLFHAGCPIPVLMSWGGWLSRPVAMHYG